MAPIKGLTDNLRMPRAGKIHLGLPMEGRAYPQPTDYFVCPPEVIAAIGDPKPKELKIMFPTEDLEQFAPAFYKLFARGRGLLCKGDGETAGRKVNMRQILGVEGVLSDLPLTPENWPVASPDAPPADVRIHKIQCNGPNCPQFGAKGCGRMMMLQFLLVDVPGLGIYQIDTGSRNGILNIYGGVELVKAMVGRISMIPLTLKIGPIETVSPETNRAQTNYVMSLSCDFSVNAMKNYRQLGPAASGLTRSLPEPDDEVPTDLIAADVEDVAPVSTPAPASVMAPPRPAPAPNPNQRRAKTQKHDPAATDYGVEMWKMTNRELTDKMQSRRLDLGVTPEALQEKATEIGLDDYKAMKPNQFTTLMDWMAAEFGEAQPVPEVPGQEITAGDERYGEQGTPEQVDSGELTREQRMAAITDDYTWEQTLSLASEFGVLTRKAFESRILRVSQQEWEELYDGTAATAARRLILTMMLAADGVVE